MLAPSSARGWREGEGGGGEDSRNEYYSFIPNFSAIVLQRGKPMAILQDGSGIITFTGQPVHLLVKLLFPGRSQHFYNFGAGRVSCDYHCRN